MSTIQPIETNRIILKPVTPVFIHELFRTQTKEDIISLFGFDEAGYEHLKKMHEHGMETFSISHLYFILVDKETNNPIGECGFHTWNRKHRRAEAFYLIRNDNYKQKGIMSEVFGRVLEFGFTEMGLHRVEALVADWNTASVKLLIKNSFKKEGTMREDYFVNGKNESSECYSLLKWEWEQSKTKN